MIKLRRIVDILINMAISLYSQKHDDYLTCSETQHVVNIIKEHDVKLKYPETRYHLTTLVNILKARCLANIPIIVYNVPRNSTLANIIKSRR